MASMALGQPNFYPMCPSFERVTMTDTIPTIHQALAAVKKAVGNVSKSQRNQQQGFNFRGIDDVVNAASGPLNENGVITIPDVESYTYETVEIGRNKTPMAHIMGLVRFTFTGPLGDSVTAKVLAESMDSGDKGAAKMMSVAYRIALLQVLNLPTDAPDPDLDSYERSGSQTASAATSKPAPYRVKSDTIKPVEPVSAEEIASLVKAIEGAVTTEQLNSVWKLAGSRGALQTEAAFGKTIQQLMYDRGDAIKSGPGNNGAPGRKTAAAK